MFKVILVAVLLASGAVLSPTPTAQADVCGDVGGRHVSVGGCTDPAARVAVAADDEAAAQAAAGQPPCYTAEGVPYYTPDGDPC
jgi:hypothetical protein